MEWNAGVGGGRRGGEINSGVDAEEDERGYARVVMGKVRIFPTTIYRAVAVLCNARLRHFFGWVLDGGREIVLGTPRMTNGQWLMGKNKINCVGSSIFKLWLAVIPRDEHEAKRKKKVQKHRVHELSWWADKDMHRNISF